MKIHTVGGYEKVGGNMTAVEVNGKIVIFDMGADIERVVDQGANMEELKTVEAIESKIVPNDSEIKRRREDVVAIVVNHGHQDHCRGVPKLAGAYDCPIIASPYTGDLIERFIDQDRENVKNDIIRMDPGDSYQISDEFELEFVNITHSIPQAVLSVLRTDDGNVVYSLDFKLDEEPTLGDPVDYDKIREIGEEGVKVYISDCTRADDQGETRTERDTKEELGNIFSDLNHVKDGIIVTTFSSHIARLNNIIETSMGARKVVFIGRSLKEYTKDAEKRGLIDLSEIEVASYRDEVENILSEAAREKSRYLLLTTGNQGEPNAVLSRIANGEYQYTAEENDMVVFSSVTIPTPANELNRECLKRKLKQRGAELKLDVHSHGHAKQRDHRKMLQLLKPETTVPAHGGEDKLSSCARLAKEEGVDSVRISNNGDTISFR